MKRFWTADISACLNGGIVRHHSGVFIADTQDAVAVAFRRLSHFFPEGCEGFKVKLFPSAAYVPPMRKPR